MATDFSFRIADLLGEHDLGLELVTDGDVDTPVVGAHAIEIPNPSRWLKPGWLMLTTGARFTGPAATAEQQRALIRELQSAGMAGLAFGVGISLDSVPEALLEEAERRRFPVLSVPLETPFLEVIDAVHQATLTRDVYLLKRTASIQDSLLEVLTVHDPAGALVHRLAELLRGTVVLYDQAGEIVASSGTGPTKLIRAEIANQPAQRQHFTIGRWHVLTEPISTDTVRHWLAVASRRHSVSRALAEPGLEAARRLIAMIVRSHASIQVEDRLRRAELLNSIAEGHADSAYAWDRLERYGFRRAAGVRLLVLTDSRWSGRRADGLDETEGLDRVASLETAAGRCGLRLLLAAPHEQRVIGLAESDAAAQQRWVAELPLTVHCGLSTSFTDLATGPRRANEAETAHAAAVREQRSAVEFDHIGLVDWLITGHDADSARAKAQQQLAPIVDNASLMRALAEYFRCGGEIQPTARKLGLHPNSVRHRLKRIGSLLDRDLSSPADIAEVSLSIRLLDIAADTSVD